MDFYQKKIVDFLNENKESWHDSRSLRGILMDCIPDKKALQSVLLIAYNEGIVEELSIDQNNNVISYKYIKKLINDYAIEEKTARWAVDTWNYIIDTNGSSPNRNSESVMNGNNNSVYSEEGNENLDNQVLDRIKLRAEMMIQDNKQLMEPREVLVDRLIKLVDYELSIKR